MKMPMVSRLNLQAEGPEESFVTPITTVKMTGSPVLPPLNSYAQDLAAGQYAVSPAVLAKLKGKGCGCGCKR